MSGTLQANHLLYSKRGSHTVRNRAITLLFLGIVGAGLFAPVFTEPDLSRLGDCVSWNGSCSTYTSYTVHVKGSLTYVMLNCGEVHYSPSGSLDGQQLQDWYLFQCG